MATTNTKTTTEKKTTTRKPVEIKHGYCNTELLNIREKPMLKSAIVCQITKSQKVTISGDVKGFYKVSIDGYDFKGYCKKDFINLDE